MKRDTGIDTLLNLDGFRHVYENAYWYKITAYRVEATDHIPHGIRYNLTFHDNCGTRIFAMDNAHVPPGKRRGFHGRVVEFDHSGNWGQVLQSGKITGLYGVEHASSLKRRRACSILKYSIF